MCRQNIINLLSGKVKLIRAEFEFTQENMSRIIGISKKSLVEIEKGRKKLSWPVAVTICTIFKESEILKMTLGDEPSDLVRIISLEKYGKNKVQTMGGKVWWKEIDTSDKYVLQQNIISGHYRILDNKMRRWFSSIDKVYIQNKFLELTKLELLTEK